MEGKDCHLTIPLQDIVSGPFEFCGGETPRWTSYGHPSVAPRSQNLLHVAARSPDTCITLGMPAMVLGAAATCSRQTWISVDPPE